MKERMKYNIAVGLLFITINLLIHYLTYVFWKTSSDSSKTYIDFLGSTWLLFFNIPFAVASFALIWYGWGEKKQDWIFPYPFARLESKLAIGESRKPEWFHTPHPQWIEYKNGYVTRRKIIDDIENSFENSHIQLIVAQPGAGKTTIAHYLGFERIKEEIEREDSHLVSFYDQKEVVVYCDLAELVNTESVKISLSSSVSEHAKNQNKQSRLLFIIDNIQCNESVGQYVFETFYGKQKSKIEFLLLSRSKRENIQNYSTYLENKFSMRSTPTILSKESFREVVTDILVEYKKLEKDLAHNLSVIITQKFDESLWMVKFIVSYLERINKFTVADVNKMTFDDIKEEVRDYYLEGDNHSVFYRIFKETSAIRKKEFLRLLLTVSEFTKREIPLHEEFLYIKRENKVNTHNIVIRLCELGELVRSENSNYVSLPHTTLANCVLAAFEDNRIQTANDQYLNYLLFCVREKPMLPIANLLKRFLLVHRRKDSDYLYANEDLVKLIETQKDEQLAELATGIAHEISIVSEPRFVDYLPDSLLQLEEVRASIMKRESYYAQRIIPKDERIEKAIKHLKLPISNLALLAIPGDRSSHLDILRRLFKVGVFESPLPPDSLIRLKLIEYLPSLLEMIEDWSNDFNGEFARVPNALRHIVEVLVEYVDFIVNNCNLGDKLQNDVTSALNNSAFLDKTINYFTSSSWRRCEDNPHLIESFDRYLKPHLSSENTKFVVNSISKILNLLKPIWCLISELGNVIRQNWAPGDISSGITPATMFPTYSGMEHIIQLDPDSRDSFEEIIEGMITFVRNHGNYEVRKLTESIKKIIEKNQYTTSVEKEKIIECIDSEPSPSLMFEIWRVIDCSVGCFYHRNKIIEKK